MRFCWLSKVSIPVVGSGTLPTPGVFPRKVWTIQSPWMSPLYLSSLNGLAFNPLSRVVSNTFYGYSVARDQGGCQLTHLLYMDNPKLYASSRENYWVFSISLCSFPMTPVWNLAWTSEVLDAVTARARETRIIDQATGNLLWHYLFQKTDCAIRREVGHRVIESCFGQRNMIYKFVINIYDQKIALFLVFCL